MTLPRFAKGKKINKYVLLKKKKTKGLASEKGTDGLSPTRNWTTAAGRAVGRENPRGSETRVEN